MHNPGSWSTATFVAWLRKNPVTRSTPDHQKIHALGDSPTPEEVGAAFQVEVTGWSRETAPAGSLGAREARGVQVRDRLAGITYEVTTDGGFLTSVTILPDDGVDLASRRPALPLSALRRLAVEANEAADADPGTALFFNTEVPANRPDTPSPEQVSDLATRIIRQGGSARMVIAKTYGVSPYTADKWLKRSRDLGLLAASTSGRPRNSAAARRPAAQPDQRASGKRSQGRGK